MKKTPILNPLAHRFFFLKASLSAMQFQRKGLVSIILIALFLLPFGNAGMGYAQTNKREALALDTSECLIITGSFDGTVKDFEGIYTAKLLKDNKIINSQVLKIKKKFAFILDKNTLYAIRVEKAGYIAKTISISTFLPDKIEIDAPFKFHFQTNLISEDLSGHFNDDDVDFPVALISYGKKCDCFEFNKEYTNSLINRMVNNLLFGE